MKKQVLSFLAATALTTMAVSAASAADLPVRAAPPAPIIAAVPVFTWTGFYVGVNAGWAWGSNNHDNGFGSVFVPAGTFPGRFATTSGTLSTPFGFGTGNRNNDGFAGGGQVGYNWQFGSWVIGAEADIQGIANNNNHNNDFAFGVVPTFATATGPGLPPGVVVVPGGGIRGLDWFGTVRARAGVAFDRALIYATGGFAYGGGGGHNNFGFFDNGSSTRTGWVVGGGVEYAFTNNLTAKVEGLWVGLNRDHHNGGVFYSAANNAIFVSDGGRRNNDFGVIRAGLNYKFNTF